MIDIKMFSMSFQVSCLIKITILYFKISNIMIGFEDHKDVIMINCFLIT